jgi:hypothetical protein
MATVIGCADGGHSGHQLDSILEEAAASFDSEGLTSATMIGNRQMVAVEKLPAAHGVPGFYVLGRMSELKKAPCAGCHTKSVAELVRTHPAGQPRAHWSTTLAHAGEDVIGCATCHAASDPGQLRLLGGAAVSIDHAYQVCAQCHTTQAADWTGGAHGKRAGGWAPPRISFNCTECHDPHAPAFASRWPARIGGR